MLCAVNTDQNELIFFRERWNPVAVQLDLYSARKIILHRQRAREITESLFRMQLHEQSVTRLHEEVLSWNFPGFHRLYRHIRFVAAFRQHSSRRQQVSRPNQEVKVRVLAHTWIAVGPD